jgi:hypothetical protein
LIGERAQDGPRDIAGQHLSAHEYDDAQQEQGDERKRYPP